MYLQTALSRGVATFSKSRSFSIWFVYVRSSFVSLKINENLRALAQSYHCNNRKIVMLFLDFNFGIMPFKLAGMGQQSSNLNDISHPLLFAIRFCFGGKLVLHCKL